MIDILEMIEKRVVLRLNYGVLLKKTNSNKQSLSSSLGQTYNNNKQELFNKNSGFKNKRSEIVGNIIFTDASYDLSYDYRFSENFNLNRNNFNVQTKAKNLGLRLSYIQLKDFASTKIVILNKLIMVLIIILINLGILIFINYEI